ncbi:hypothetical protein BDQ17DRAFT_954477 [Cyathus striatus]|nr:hypothetical protein BDQ17DRAFT_954477 [Cyathus striatus]
MDLIFNPENYKDVHPDFFHDLETRPTQVSLYPNTTLPSFITRCPTSKEWIDRATGHGSFDELPEGLRVKEFRGPAWHPPRFLYGIYVDRDKFVELMTKKHVLVMKTNTEDEDLIDRWETLSALWRKMRDDLHLEHLDPQLDLEVDEALPDTEPVLLRFYTSYEPVSRPQKEMGKLIQCYLKLEEPPKWYLDRSNLNMCRWNYGPYGPYTTITPELS